MLIKEAMLTEEQKKSILSEVRIRTSRSGGSGGQHVNKTETRVQLEFDIHSSYSLTEQVKAQLLQKTGRSTILITSDKHRSQSENKLDAFKKLMEFLEKALKPVKKRKATKPTKASKIKKTEAKKKQSDKKRSRRRPDPNQ